jgi:hypothetical protein
MYSDSNTKKSVYPWLRLLDMDVQRVERPKKKRGKGRPRSLFPRKSIHTTLTEDELLVLDSIVSAISNQIGSGVHRGNVIAFMAFRLYDLLRYGSSDDIIDLPDNIASFSDLAEYLDAKEAEKKL